MVHLYYMISPVIIIAEAEYLIVKLYYWVVVIPCISEYSKDSSKTGNTLSRFTTIAKVMLPGLLEWDEMLQDSIFSMSPVWPTYTTHL